MPEQNAEQTPTTLSELQGRLERLEERVLEILDELHQVREGLERLTP